MNLRRQLAHGGGGLAGADACALHGLIHAVDAVNERLRLFRDAKLRGLVLGKLAAGHARGFGLLLECGDVGLLLAGDALLSGGGGACSFFLAVPGVDLGADGGGLGAGGLTEARLRGEVLLDLAAVHAELGILGLQAGEKLLLCGREVGEELLRPGWDDGRSRHLCAGPRDRVGHLGDGARGAIHLLGRFGQPVT